MYIVTGHMRHGTSAMMGALIAGGVDAYYDRGRMDFLNGQTSSDDDFEINSEVYEPGPDDFHKKDFPRAHAGKLIKVMTGGLLRLMPMEEGIRYVVMQRHPEEARQSHEASFAPVKGIARAPFLRSQEAYDEHFARVQEHLWNRKDTLSVDVVRFREDLVEDPRGVFERLRANGWPITNIDAAVEHIDAGRVRFKLEELEVGV